jgi:hypothetical protein
MALKEIFAPHLGRTVKMGRKRPVALGPRLHLKNYLRLGTLPTPPGGCNYASKAAASLSDIYLNDKLGCCVIAGGYHVVGVETGNADGGTPYVASSAQIEADYSAIGGYNPSDPSTDQGCDPATALNYWTQHGFANGTKLCSWMVVDPTNQQEVMLAMYLFENLFFGVELPDVWTDPFPSANGFVWDDGAPDPAHGHAFCGVGYDSQGVQIDTWGLIGTMTWKAIAHLCSSAANGQLFVMLSPDQVAKGQAKAPNGLDWQTLQEDFGALGGNLGPTPPPAPPPAPAPPAPQPSGMLSEFEAIGWAAEGIINGWPAPGTPVTLANAQAWASAGLAEHWPTSK